MQASGRTRRSRASGTPLVNELVIGLRDKDKFNASEPKRRCAVRERTSRNPTLPVLINALFGVPRAGDAAQRPRVGVPHRRARA